MSRPVVAIIANALTPYRLHFHRRLVRELPQYEWWSLFTHDVSNAPWKLEDEQEIRSVRFGPGESADDQAKFSRAFHECRKGGRIIKWLNDHQVTAVVLLGYNDCGRLRILRWCHRQRIPCLLFGDSNIHGDKATGLKVKIKRWLLPKILRKCSAILACGSLGRAYFRSYGVEDQRIFYAPYEPDYQLIADLTQHDIQQNINRFQLPVNKDFILYCGRLVDVKRVDLMIDSFAMIADRRLSWNLVIAGDGPLRSSLQSRVPDNLQSRIHWLGFIDDQRCIAALQRAAKILVLPSDFEPWALVINEAAAAGCAIIATEAVGAAAELVRDHVNGRIVPCGDMPALTNALLEVTDKVDDYRKNSATVLDNWRKQADPVRGLAKALKFTRQQSGRAAATSRASP